MNGDLVRMVDIQTGLTPRREQTRQKLLDAAAEVFAEVGLAAASVEAVCERAGFTRGAFYSNFETKDELFLELAHRVAQERVSAVHARVVELAALGELKVTAENALGLIEQVLEMGPDDRLGVLLTSEIRIHALRNPDLAAGYLAQQRQVLLGVSQIFNELCNGKGLTLRLPAEDAAWFMMSVWEAEATRSVMRGDERIAGAEAKRTLARVARLILESD